MTTEVAPRRSWLQALATYRRPHIFAMLCLGFSAGLPFLLVFATLSAWLAQVDVSRTMIGLFSWIGITYSIKVFWAPVVDRLPIPLLTRWLGRRRSWMLLAQFGVATGLLGLATSDPGVALELVAWLALLVAFSSATQDIAVDAWRIEAAPRDEQGAMAAAYQMGYRIALLVAGAGALFLAAEYSWMVAYTVMAACMGVGVLTSLVIREPAAQASVALNEPMDGSALQRFARWFYTAVAGPFVDFFARNGVRLGIIILAFIGLFRVTDITMGVMANPFYLDMGYTLKEIAAVAKGFGVLMTIFGTIVGGVVVARIGAERSLVLGGIFVILTNLSFALLAVLPDPGVAGLTMVISADNFSGGFAGTAFIAYLSGLTNVAYTATQYALFSSLFTLPGKLIAGGSGWVVDSFSYPVFFLYTSALGIPALLIISYLIRHPRVSPQGDEKA
ncbi:major facilitator superfamily permease [Oceanococcus atlanticus]|uniref:Major facilitator superfamily permease n=1 Tax=Oceanococcus atlanticus TaxID=1317117 RepID=A0A1Y1SBH5_9GAMM|nr:MFS transporter [Oceanococcus atlanticus]ORE85250.1 major facilitator superfamily permease [Oceanococcus atlanticus]